MDKETAKAINDVSKRLNEISQRLDKQLNYRCDDLSHNIDAVSDAWNDKKTYYAGEYCICDNIVWKAKVTNTNQKPSSQDKVHWEATTIVDELNYIINLINK